MNNENYVECDMRSCPQYDNQFEGNNVCRECDDRPDQEHEDEDEE